MSKRILWVLGVPFFLALSVPTNVTAQSMNASISGTVADPTGALVPSAELILKAVATAAEAKFTDGGGWFLPLWEPASGRL
jgi:hypothetical protein